jgi:copper(I)-binding protein
MIGLVHWAVLLLALVGGGTSAIELNPEDEAEVYQLGNIRIVDPWAKSSGTGARAAKLFFEFQNDTNQSDKLVSARSPIASGATKFQSVLVNDAGRSVATIDAIEIPASEKVFELTEVGYYVELNGLEQPVLMGTRFPVELRFERGGSITIEFAVRFHSPKLARRIRDAAARGDIEALKALRPSL